eukprot:TRINITY_DN19730_c0_g1_i1.p1 TRINITY_DN19730_c0_g1~~TRINITY_DN19730_c0_g1_i1.p1  ORF type:complete len:587 (+),score=43.54 TRINITY_DN19730_c0_g1_i1:209-1762(+)
MDVRWTSQALCACDPGGKQLLTLPLKCALIADRFCPAPGAVPQKHSILGGLAYGYPCSSSMPTLSNVWIIVVSCGVHDSSTTGYAIMHEAVDTLSRCGTIRNTHRCFQSLGTCVGVGGYGSARLVRQRCANDCEANLEINSLRRIRNQQECYIAKTILQKADEEPAVREIDALVSSQGHPNVMEFHAAFCMGAASAVHQWIILARSYGGGNIPQIVDRDGAMSSWYALQLTQDILSALDHIHACGFIHLDVKPANVVRDERGRAIVVDFGSAMPISSSDNYELRGTPGHIAPELLYRKRLTPRADVFSCGTVTYFAVSGFLPFHGSDEEAIIMLNSKADVTFPSPQFDDVSTGAIHAIRQLLSPSETLRPSTKEALAIVDQAMSSCQHMVAHELDDEAEVLSSLSSATGIIGRAYGRFFTREVDEHASFCSVVSSNITHLVVGACVSLGSSVSALTARTSSDHGCHDKCVHVPFSERVTSFFRLRRRNVQRVSPSSGESEQRKSSLLRSRAVSWNDL